MYEVAIEECKTLFFFIYLPFVEKQTTTTLTLIRLFTEDYDAFTTFCQQ